MFQQIENYNKNCRFFTGSDIFQTALNNKPVMNKIETLNKKIRLIQ